MGEIMMKLLSMEVNVDEDVEFLQLEQSQEASKHFECDICEFKCKKQITLKQHANTKHAVLATKDESSETSVCESEW